MLKDNSKIIKFYKGIVIQQIYDHLQNTDEPMTKAQIDQDIKINAEFPFESCTHEDVQSEDLQNLVIWGFLYGDAVGVFLDYPPDELDELIKLNI